MSKKHKAKITIDDIALAAGVSTATVSRALNKPDSVSPKLRSKITKTVKSIGYIPSGAARALASNRSFTVGAIIPTLKNAIFAATLSALEENLSRHNYTLLVTVSNYDDSQEQAQLQKLLERGVDGVVLVGLSHSRATWDMLAQTKCCALTIWGSEGDGRLPTIGFDNESSAGLIVDHLASLGHTRIGMIAGITKDNDRAAARVRGTKTALKNLGLEVDDNLFIERRYSLEEGREGLNLLLDQTNPPTAIVCGNDVLAIGVLSAAQAQSIRVPEQLSITGFDNLPITEYIWPNLTTVNIPSEKIGFEAAQSIVDYLSTGVEIESKLLETSLLIRGTTGMVDAA